MSERYDCTDPAQRAAGLAEAAAALRKGELIVMPTDTVYGIGADAFTPGAVAALLAAKGRGRHMPVAVLVGTLRAALALVEDPGPFGKDLMEEFWPGGLTIVLPANRSLAWDLGETRGTVAVRMPLHPVAIELLKDTGPLAVSSANRSGSPPATTAAEAEAQLGGSVAVYLDGGPCPSDVASSVVDLTGPVPRLLRAGAITAERLRGLIPLEEPAPSAGGDLPSQADGQAAAPPGAGRAEPGDAARDEAAPGGAGPGGAEPAGAEPDDAARDEAAPGEAGPAGPAGAEP